MPDTPTTSNPTPSPTAPTAPPTPTTSSSVPSVSSVVTNREALESKLLRRLHDAFGNSIGLRTSIKSMHTMAGTYVLETILQGFDIPAHAAHDLVTTACDVFDLIDKLAELKGLPKQQLF
jgi:hypothetical protein